MLQNYWKILKSECPDIWIRLPRHKWSKSWSSMEDPVVPLERNLYGHPLTGLLWERQFEKDLLGHDWGKVSNFEYLFVHQEKGLFLSVYVNDIKLTGKKQNINPMWKVLNKEVDLGESTSFLDHVYLDVHSKTMWNKQGYYWQSQNHVWIQNFRSRNNNWKNIMSGKSEYLFVILWNGRSCQDMCGTILWVDEKKNDSTTLQSINSMSWRPSLQRRRIETRGRIVKSILSNCSEMLILGQYWTARYSMVIEQTCTIDYKMDQSLWQTIISFDLLHSSYMWLQLILSCGKHCKIMQIGTVSRLRFCRRSWGLKISFRWDIMHFRKSYVWSNHLDV